MPIEVEAIQWTGENFPAIKAFASGAVGIGELGGRAIPLWTVKSKAVNHVQRGDWIIREPDGSGFYPCERAAFAATYEPAGAPDPVAAERERIAKLADGVQASFRDVRTENAERASFADLIREVG
jgi:hypothetical protein